MDTRQKQPQIESSPQSPHDRMVTRGGLKTDDGGWGRRLFFPTGGAKPFAKHSC
jgi:hypothetical protein